MIMKAKTYILSRNRRIYNLIYKLYWFLLFKFPKDCNNLHSNNHRVYDHYGIIDTLGYNYDEGKYTFSYSEELGGYSGIILPFGWCLEFSDDPEPYIKLRKFQSLL